MIIEVVPPHKYGGLVAKTGIATIAAMVLGPIVGGQISATTTWRWIFLFNVPVGVVALLLALLGIPTGFPRRKGAVEQSAQRPSATWWERLDLLGCALIFLASTSFTACFQEADSRFAWDSAYVITLLVASVVFWALLLVWQRRVTNQNTPREPVLPWRFFTNRSMVGILMGMILVGAVMTATGFQLPQRFQVVNGLSSIDAGVRVLPFGAGFPVGLAAGSTAASRFRVPGIYIALTGSVLQIIACALLGTLPLSVDVDPAIYGYQVLSGIGCGTTYQMLYLLIPFTAEQPDKAVGMGAGNQFRTMGAAFGIAITTSVFNHNLRAQMPSMDSISDLIQGELTGDGASVLPGSQKVIQLIAAEGYNRQMLVLCGFAAAQIPTSMLMWRRKQVVAV
jgi:predicted MFS family arabinose efflux permease